MSKFFSTYWGIFFVMLLSISAIKPFFLPGFFPTHDDTQVARIFEMGKALHDGMFPVRWVNDLGYGYGYPIFNFYAPLAYYFGGFLVMGGLNALLATKIIMVGGILFAGIAMYIFARNFWGEIGGVISAVFYIYATYHAVEIYVRGDLAEFWAYAAIPLLFLGCYKVYIASLRNKKYPVSAVMLGGISYACIILSHNLTALMTTMFTLLFIFILIGFSENKMRAAWHLGGIG